MRYSFNISDQLLVIISVSNYYQAHFELRNAQKLILRRKQQELRPQTSPELPGIILHISLETMSPH